MTGMTDTHIRMPTELYEMITASASSGGRSISKEMVIRLQVSFEVRSLDEIAKNLTRVALRMTELVGKMENSGGRSSAAVGAGDECCGD